MMCFCTGLSWQDDITQYILSKELKRVPHTTQTSKPHSSSSQSPYLAPYVVSKRCTFCTVVVVIIVCIWLFRTKHHSPHHHKSGSTSPGGNYMDYMIVEPPQMPLRMQTASADPYSYHQVPTHVM